MARSRTVAGRWSRQAATGLAAVLLLASCPARAQAPGGAAGQAPQGQPAPAERTLPNPLGVTPWVPPVVTPAPAPTPAPAVRAVPLRENVEADVSTRSVAITSSFTGTEIVVFGAVVNSIQPNAAQPLYDIVVVLEGTEQRLVARRKSRVAGIWVNTQSLTFESVPSYYAIASTRPLDEIADAIVLRDHDVGFERVTMKPIRGWETGITTADLAEFKQAVIRLKRRDGLYVESEYGVAFVGTNLFRTTIDLPANVPVGPLEARIYLFREGQVVGTFRTRVTMAREGLERLMHNFAFGYPLFYGVFTVLTAIGAGLIAQAAFRRAGH